VHEIELILALLVAVAALAPVAPMLRVPYPILLVLVGLLVALIPGVPEIKLAPDLVFLLFLPPLLYIAAFNTSIRDVRAYLRPILSLAVGLVLATTAAVAVLTHALLPELGWPVAFALGAIVSPPDAVAAAATFRGLGVPRRLVTILECESLFNDATALVAYRAALAATATATFSAGEASLHFLAIGAGGVLVGLAVGRAVAGLRKHLDDPPVEITVSLLTPVAAYLAADVLGVSGVLATVTTGLCVGWWAPSLMAPDTRLRGRAVWETLVFILNGLVFILIGLQLSTILAAPSGRPLLAQAGFGLLISFVVILVRLAWVFGATYLPGWRSLAGHSADALPRWQEAFVIAWAGMRGVVSLATVLALPLTIPERDLLILVTFCLILVTLVGQGLSLPWIIRTLRVVDDGAGEHQELHARVATDAAATARIEQLALEWPTHLPLIDTLRAQYAHRASHAHNVAHAAEDEAAHDGHGDEAAEQELFEHRLIRRAVIDAERAAVLDLRRRGEINDEAWRRIERDLDLEELRMEA
jgi:CPA1 family monovalent cation:H+ antiporter